MWTSLICIAIDNAIQLLMCRRGEDIILITLNHLDTIRKLIGNSEHHLDLIDSAIKTLTEVSHRFYLIFSFCDYF